MNQAQQCALINAFLDNCTKSILGKFVYLYAYTIKLNCIQISGNCFSKRATSYIREKQQQILSKNNKLKKMCKNFKQKKNYKVRRYFKNLLMSKNFRTRLPEINAMKSKLLRLGWTSAVLCFNPPSAFMWNLPPSSHDRKFKMYHRLWFTLVQ